jgi:hypothetical protein
MVSGFRSAEDFQPVIGWQLYQVTLDKYHVMFFFENGWQLLNVAHATRIGLLMVPLPTPTRLMARARASR